MKALILLASIIIAGTMPTLVSNSWVYVPDTKLIDKAPLNGEFPYTWGIAGPKSV
ncbi:MAG: hypothetical protein JNL74_03255, partial [Fibrobacteres bacterium]|nr:hypothetical protein [Fibrobacterota bacterium]